MKKVRNHEAEAFADAIEDMMKLELKELESLRKLGKPVDLLKKHANNEMCLLSQTLIDVWEVIVDEWVDRNNETSPKTPNLKPRIYHEPLYVPTTVIKVSRDPKHEVLMRKNQVSIVKPKKPSCSSSKVNSDLKAGYRMKFQPSIQSKALSAQRGDQNPKSLRKVQVIELHSLPKQGLSHKPSHTTPGNHRKIRPNGNK